MTAHPILGWTPAAVVFDCDGTLMDTEQHWQQARDLVLSGYGVEAGPDFAQRAKGLHYADCGRLMAETAGEPALAEQMTRQLLNTFRKLVAEDPVTMPGAAELVHRTSRFAPLAVASNCPRDVVESSLGTAGLRHYFGQIVVPGDGVRPKPDPDVYLAAARSCGAEPADCLAVEDSRCGIEAAVRAGMRVIGVGRRPGREEQARADLWVSSLSDPDLMSWAENRVPRQQAVG